MIAHHNFFATYLNCKSSANHPCCLNESRSVGKKKKKKIKNKQLLDTIKFC